ncbi:hypothetical protein SAMN05216339_101153 [Nitrosomonas eutropha]|uniref:Uncharacterized protein n=1 Tax=Nitrosomonas eutropha TaxID=916 RepID=A0A1I7EXT6_9PROT|nr:hypothetical protein [Nitrosomonas eutropha]SFU28711.1 hypothetical protein SAMN05216339_101153 [Nitrosomonas eutropha]
MLQFLPVIAPATIFLVKAVFKKQIEDGIADGIITAKYEVERNIWRALFSTFSNISINVTLLTSSVYLLPFITSKEIVIYIICSVYLGSIFYSLYSVIKNMPLVLKIFFDHKLNLKEYVHSEIYIEAYKEAHYQISEKNIVIRILNNFWGASASSIASTISRRTTNIVIKKVTSIVFIVIVLLLVYSLIFRIMVAPLIIENATQFNVFQAAIYPLLYAIDYFFSTNLVSWLMYA